MSADFDMRRLHHGCGEALLPATITLGGKTRPKSTFCALPDGMHRIGGDLNISPPFLALGGKRR
jgi:hypothetical protein